MDLSCEKKSSIAVNGKSRTSLSLVKQKITHQFNAEEFVCETVFASRYWRPIWYSTQVIAKLCVTVKL